MSLKEEDLEKIIRLRFAVGCLGEQGDAKWWKGSFLSPSSKAFLKPIFNKTSHIAIYQGVKQEASIIHDEHIGQGKGTYHLFRLPETLEIDLLDIVKNNKNIVNYDIESSYTYLESLKIEKIANKVGPTFIDTIEGLSLDSNWQKIASYYLKAFRDSKFVYPFFSRSENDG
jgi:hypothetical protein